jgi:hypothetical protein
MYIIYRRTLYENQVLEVALGADPEIEVEVGDGNKLEGYKKSINIYRYIRTRYRRGAPY